MLRQYFEKAQENEKKFKIPKEKCREILNSMEGIDKEGIKHLIEEFKLKSPDGNQLTGP